MNKPNPIDIVFDGPPSHESGRFVEVENSTGKSIKFGDWVQRADGYWVLRIYAFTIAEISDALEFLSYEDKQSVLDRLGVNPSERHKYE